MTYRPLVLNKLVKLVDHHLGSLIEEIAEKYYGKDIDLELEYDDVLKFITEKLLGDSFEYSEEEFRETLREIIGESSISKLLISYLLSKYIEESIREESYSDYDNDDIDEFEADLDI